MKTRIRAGMVVPPPESAPSSTTPDAAYSGRGNRSANPGHCDPPTAANRKSAVATDATPPRHRWHAGAMSSTTPFGESFAGATVKSARRHAPPGSVCPLCPSRIEHRTVAPLPCPAARPRGAEPCRPFWRVNGFAVLWNRRKVVTRRHGLWHPGGGFARMRTADRTCRTDTKIGLIAPLR